MIVHGWSGVSETLKQVTGATKEALGLEGGVDLYVSDLPAFNMTVLNDLDRFHLVVDTIDRLPHIGDSGNCLKQLMYDKLKEHKRYIETFGEDMPEIRDWTWGASPT